MQRLTASESTWIGGIAILAGMLVVLVGMSAGSVAAGVTVTFVVGFLLVGAVSLMTSRSGSH